MIRQSPCTGRSRRRGFSMMEMIIASMLAAMLGILLAQAVVTFGRPAMEVEARAKITQESILAAQSLACDLGGYLADSPGQTGTSGQSQFVDWDISQGTPPGTVLLLNFQGTGLGNPPPPVVITYNLTEQGNHLVRSNSSTGVTTTIANYVTGFTVEQDPGNASYVQIKISIAFPCGATRLPLFTAMYTLIGVPPS